MSKRNATSSTAAPSQATGPHSAAVHGAALDIFAYTADCLPSEVPRDILPILAQHINNTQSSKDVLVHSVMLVRKLFAVKPHPIDQAINTQIGPRLATFLQPEYDTDLELQGETCWVFNSMLGGDPAQQFQYVIDLGVIPNFIRLLQSQDEYVLQGAAWTLGSLMSASVASRDYVSGLGAVDALMAAMKVPSVLCETTRSYVCALSIYCRPISRPASEQCRQLLTVFSSLLDHYDDEIVINAAWGLSYLSEGPPERVQSVLNLGVLSRVVQMMSSPQVAKVLPALRIVGNIAAGNDLQSQVLITAGVLPRLHHLLRHTNPKITKEVCWLLSNITACNEVCIQAVVVEGLFPAVFECMHSRDAKTKREAVWVVRNVATVGSVEQVRFLVEAGALRHIIDVLSSDDTDTLIEVLETMGNILETMEEEENDTNNVRRNIAAAEMQKLNGRTAIADLVDHKSQRVQVLVHSLQKYLA